MNTWSEISRASLPKRLAGHVSAIVMVSIMLFTMVPSAFAESLDDGNGSAHSLTVIDADGNIPVFADGAWNLTGGTYTVSGVAQNHEGLRVTGDVTLNLNGATIDHSTLGPPTKNTTAGEIAQYAPAISIEAGSVRTNLIGANTAAGAPGYAGIYVAEGATLVVAGNGSLSALGGNACPDISFYESGIGKFLNGVPLPSAFGVGEGQRGYYTGGAGIGGNGVWVKLPNPGNSNICEEIPGSSSNFGTVRIDGGTINATGGNSSDKIQFCAGAGIGTGGGTGITTPDDTYWSLNNPFSGTVEINGGTIVATGGVSTNYFKTGGGAGIGTGGLSGNRYYCNSDVGITINDGRVSAIGKSNGAGIGGGENVPSGIITIAGGFVEAQGGDCRSDSPANGGAGIGGGDGDWNYAWFIDISGGTVVATGAGDAAGIGIGYGGWFYGDVYLRGSADVTAYGGFGRDGGNGISANTVHLWNQADVRAYARGNARGIVYGDGLDVAGITSLWIQTEDAGNPAISSLGGITYSSSSTYLVTDWDYQTGSASAPIAYGWLDLPSGNLEGDKQFEFAWTDDGLTIDGNPVPLSAGAKPTGGSWAALYQEIHFITVSYEYVGDSYPDEIMATLPSSVEIVSGTAFTAEKPAAVEGWAFDGWYADEACASAFEDGTVLDANTVLYGKWLQETVPVGPVVAAYKTEHYQERLDGSYALAETNFPLYGTVGMTVDAAVKDYAHYHVNSELSVLSGVVVPPAVEDGELKILTLKVYYDLDRVVLSYDLNQGTGVYGVDYAPERVGYGAAVIVKPAPMRDGYAFLEWSDGASAYGPGDVIVLTADTMLVARWEEGIPVSPEGEDPAAEPQGGSPQAKPEQKGESLGGLSRAGDVDLSRLLGLVFALCGSVFMLAFVAYREHESN